MSVSEANKNTIRKISKRGTDKYVDLPKFFKRFNYPVSLELSKYVGKIVYQKGSADALELLCLMVNKCYTRIMRSVAPKPIFESFIVVEGELIEEKTRVLINAVKRWEAGSISEFDFASAITDFCRNTYGVRLPMVSFFLRMLLPNKFGTLDVRCIHALQSLGFEIKDVPSGEVDKDAYFSQYGGKDYLTYNELLTEIGTCYQMPSKLGGQRHMTPSEVDMALYEYDKEAGWLETPTTPSKDILLREEKVRKIMDIVKEIVNGTRTGPAWVRRAGDSFFRTMRQYAESNDIDSMFSYYTRLARGMRGKSVARWLKSKHLSSIESEYRRVEQIYRDC